MLVLDRINLELQGGDALAVMGPNGCGKSTLAYSISGIIPRFVFGQYYGTVMLFGRKIQKEQPLKSLTKELAFLFQNPEDQFLSFSVKDEFSLAASDFGKGLDTYGSITQFLEKYKSLYLLNKSPSEMSMGELQRISILVAAFQKPKVIILDEPTTALDVQGLSLVKEVMDDLPGSIKIINTHDFGWAKRVCTRIVGLNKGSFIFDLPTQNVGDANLVSLFAEKNYTERKNSIYELIDNLQFRKTNVEYPDPPSIIVNSLTHTYGRFEGAVFEGINFDIPSGKLACIMGPNGSGKSTLLLLIAGLLKPKSGKISYNSIPIEKVRKKKIWRIAVMLQNPSYQIITETIRDELTLSLRQLSENSSFVSKIIGLLKNILGISDLETSPQALSFGWKKVLSLLGCLCLDPDVLILDEPELGLDPYHIDIVAEVISYFSSLRKTIFIVSHDQKFVNRLSDSYFWLENGKLILKDSKSGYPNYDYGKAGNNEKQL